MSDNLGTKNYNINKEVYEMSDREIAEETLLILRTFAETFMAMSQNPMLKAMMPGM